MLGLWLVFLGCLSPTWVSPVFSPCVSLLSLATICCEPIIRWMLLWNDMTVHCVSYYLTSQVFTGPPFIAPNTVHCTQYPDRNNRPVLTSQTQAVQSLCCLSDSHTPTCSVSSSSSQPAPPSSPASHSVSEPSSDAVILNNKTRTFLLGREDLLVIISDSNHV